MTAASMQGSPLALPPACPPSLRRQAPEIARVTNVRGQPLHVSTAGLLLAAHQRYQVRVIPPPCPDGDKLTISLAADEHIRPIGTTQEHVLGDGKKEYVLTFATSRLLRPIPAQSQVSIVLNHPRWGEYAQELPVVIWPTKLNTIVWALSLVASTIWAPYLGQAAVHDGHLRPLPELVRKLTDSKELGFITVGATIGVAFLVYAMSWVFQLCTRSDS